MNKIWNTYDIIQAGDFIEDSHASTEEHQQMELSIAHELA